MTERETQITDALRDDGDMFELDDTRRLMLRIEYDPDASINDYDGDGKVSDYHEYRWDGSSNRPDGFTGRARKIEADRSGFVWWEPYGDTMGWQDDSGLWLHARWEQLPRDIQRKEIDRITDLIRDGFKQVGLELQELVQDSIGGEHWVEVATAWISGVDSVEGEYLADIILDLTVELPVPVA